MARAIAQRLYRVSVKGVFTKRSKISGYLSVRTFAQFIEFVAANIEFSPDVIIDVGVAWGTPALYENFPDAYLVLIEALPYFERNLMEILTSHDGEYHIKAASDAPGAKSVRVADDQMALAGANIVDFPGKGDLRYDIEIVRLDRLLNWERFEGSILLKLDVQGADLRALKGVGRYLEKCDLIIIEASIHNPHNLAGSIIAYLENNGFRLYDIFGVSYRPYDGSLGQIDIAFARPNSKFFSCSAWS